LCLLVKEGVIDPRAYHQVPCFEAAVQFARTEGFLPAPETSHAIRCGIDEALKCKATGEEKCIVIAYSGHGFFDLTAYDNYFNGQLEDYEYPQQLIEEALKCLPPWENPVLE
jgi:tryptophan synthase beta chain